MCDIWQNTTNQEIPVGFVDQHLDEFQELGVQWIVLTGGEPLMHSDLFTLCDRIRGRGIRVTVLSSGLLMKAAEQPERVAVLLPGVPAAL